MAKYVCSVCGYEYDEAVELGPFAQLPDDYICPVCGAGKDAFTEEK
ncbi:MAG TPA: rubredoxin [Terriglobales bacterium]|nr:rubredoxin [Candidatus Acidoferrum sp.]HWQ51684.1 rubredoxin [Terriglobales bacterium]